MKNEIEIVKRRYWKLKPTNDHDLATISENQYKLMGALIEINNKLDVLKSRRDFNPQT